MAPTRHTAPGRRGICSSHPRAESSLAPVPAPEEADRTAALLVAAPEKANPTVTVQADEPHDADRTAFPADPPGSDRLTGYGMPSVRARTAHLVEVSRREERRAVSALPLMSWVDRLIRWLAAGRETDGDWATWLEELAELDASLGVPTWDAAARVEHDGRSLPMLLLRTGYDMGLVADREGRRLIGPALLRDASGSAPGRRVLLTFDGSMLVDHFLMAVRQRLLESPPWNTGGWREAADDEGAPDARWYSADAFARALLEATTPGGARPVRVFEEEIEEAEEPEEALDAAVRLNEREAVAWLHAAGIVEFVDGAWRVPPALQASLVAFFARVGVRVERDRVA